MKKKPNPRDELSALETKCGQTLGDPESKEIIALLRSEGILDDEAWQEALAMYEATLCYLREPDTEDASEDSCHDWIINLDADPCNANWIKIVGAWRKIGHKLPDWVSMWLWTLGYERKEEFWRRVALATRSHAKDDV